MTRGVLVRKKAIVVCYEGDDEQWEKAWIGRRTKEGLERSPEGSKDGTSGVEGEAGGGVFGQG